MISPNHLIPPLRRLVTQWSLGLASRFAIHRLGRNCPRRTGTQPPIQDLGIVSTSKTNLFKPRINGNDEIRVAHCSKDLCSELDRRDSGKSIEQLFLLTVFEESVSNTFVPFVCSGQKVCVHLQLTF